MLQYLITAMDGDDESALERRMAVRPAHFVKARELKAAGNFIMGGAILDKDGNMRGSMMVVQFSTEEELKQWMDNEPYVAGKVWQHIDVKPFRVADV
jgi:uncharacterized protein